ncbi:helix-turn-helix transcriptional regulator [Catellatospora sp. NPDC049111]|uniref:helix-turn-helix transcriptional regulator n=1 Tax=Catellatospora sp. NPDC049111 TaxID=3155271 RepID=UPI0033CBCBB8
MTMSERGHWQLVEGRPHPRLRGIVYGYRGFNLRLAEPVRRLEFPVPFVNLTVTWRGSLQLSAAAGRSARLGQLVAGMSTGVVHAEHDGDLEGVDVRLWPLGGYRLFDGYATGGGSHILTLADIMGADADRLTARLADCPDWAGRFRLLDAVLLRRAAAGREPCPRTAAVWQRVQRDLSVPVAALAADAAWSERHLQSRFRDHFGMTPKAAQRVARLQRALRALDAGLPASRVAHLARYSDQAHLIREVKAMTGLTPAALTRHRAASWRPTDRSQTEITSVFLA